MTRSFLAVALAAAVLTVGCTPTTPSTPAPVASPTATTPGAPASPTPATPAATATPSAEPTTATIVYFPRDSTQGIRLGREERQVQADDALGGALEAMLEGPHDADYADGWADGTRLLGVERNGSVTTVDLSAEARTTTLGSEGSSALVQQVVWTVTEQTGAGTQVLLTVEGEPAGELWGVVSWSEPIGREDPLDARVLVSIDAPTDGEAVTSPVTVRGDAAVFEATLPWRVLDAGGAVVQEGFTNTAAGQEFAAYSFDLTLEPGEYTVEVREDDPSDGEGGPVDVDTRRIVVQGT